MNLTPVLLYVVFRVHPGVVTEWVSVSIIIIIIKCIYKAHFRGCHKCAKNSSYTLNNNVFSLFLNVVRVISDDLSSS